MIKRYKTREMLLDEIEELENKVNTLEQDVDYFSDNWYQLLKQKTKLIKYLEEHGATFILSKIKEIENEKD